MPTLIEVLEAQHADNYGWALACCDWRQSDASDVLQEAYLRVLDGRAQFSSKASERTWFFGVVRRVAQEQRRKAQRWWKPGWATEAEEPQTELEDDVAQADAEARALREALMQLSARQREIMHLVFYAELTLEEAASALDIGLGSARTHYHRGKQKLAELLNVEDES